MRELSDPLTEEDKAWLRSWNREAEIPGEEENATVQMLVPGAPPGGETNPVNQPSDPFNGEEPPEDYNDWTADQLRAELEDRKLPKSGNKPDLVSRLVEDDESSEGDDGDGDD